MHSEVPHEYNFYLLSSLCVTLRFPVNSVTVLTQTNLPLSPLKTSRTKKILRSRSVARIFATERLLNLIFMRRDIFQAIADPTRRAILVLVAVQAMTPNAIAEHFDITRQSISKHLRILSECDLLAQKQEGREIFYELKIDKMNEIDTWLDQFRKIMEQRFQRLDEVLSTLKNKKSCLLCPHIQKLRAHIKS